MNTNYWTGMCVKSTLLLFAGMILFACSPRQSPPEAFSPVETTIVENDDLFRALSLEAVSERERGLFAPLTGAAVSLARVAVFGLITDERERQISVYEDARSDLFFYNELSDLHPLDPSGMQFQGLEVTRHQNVDGRRQRAFYAAFEIDDSNPNELLNNSVFRLRLTDLDLAHTESPHSRRWYRPWTWFRSPEETVNLSLVITFYADWIDDAQRIHSGVPMGRFVLSLEDAPLRGTPGYADFISNLDRIPVSGYSYMIPRSTGFAYNAQDELEKKYGQGRYSISIDLRESRTQKPEQTTLMKITR